MKYPKRSQYKYAKSQYRVRNWPEYEAGLKKRGDLTVWFADDALDAWRVPAEGKPGGQRTYSDVAIEAALTIRMVFHLPLRQTEGFLRCLADMLEVDLPIPDHTTLSRRLKKLGEIRVRQLTTGEPIHVLIDSTGLRIHVGCTQVPPLLDQIIDPIASVSADGAYDTKAVYEAAHGRGEGRAVRVLIPPGRDAQLNSHPSVAQRERNRNICSIRELGRREWHTSSGYSKPSLVENTMYRYKMIIGRGMRSRTFDGQRVEVQLASKILNTMTQLGMPDSCRVA